MYIMTLAQWLTLLTWIALPVTVVAVIDDWFLRPQRQLAALPGAARDPPLMSAVYVAEPLLVLAAVLNLLMSERLDFSLVLVLVVAVSGLVYLLDRLVFAPLRARAATLRGQPEAAVPLPVTVDYARSFLPVAALVLVIRAFIFEPFRIPSDSMMPTLLDGDFIIVNKYAYGLRLPVLGKQLVAVGEPQRGDVVVFRYPPDPGINYIKRLVGLPGDTVRVHDDQLIVNGQTIALHYDGRFIDKDGCYSNMRESTEMLGSHRHQTLSCLSPQYLAVPPVASCKRHIDRSYVCDERAGSEYPDAGDTGDIVVPAGHYLMIGDNRDNSADSRVWGFVPEENLVGKATRIWFNWDWKGWDWGHAGGPLGWHRIGQKID
jgi:signal peptidase I